MLKVDWSDVLGVLQTCKPYLIAIAAVILVAVAVIIAVRKVKKPLRGLIRGETVMAMLLAICILVNGIIWNPMYAIISMAMGKGSVTDATTARAEEVAEDVAAQGFVLLQNRDGFLPMSGTNKLNLFGWAASNPAYGGTGSGGINDLFPVVSLRQGLENAGYQVNGELLDFYTAYCASRGAMNIEAKQKWDLPEPPVSTYTDSMINNAKSFSDVAVIVISRYAGEGHNDIPQDMTKATYTNNSKDYDDFQPGEHYLQLSKTEQDMVKLTCDNFDKVIVVLNSAYAMEMGWVEQYSQIKSVIWAPGPGNVGFNALGKILNGTVNPSGRTNDTFVYEIDQAPYYLNAEKTDYSNLTDMTVDGMNAGVPTKYAPSFINYNENIYVGYKFYETAAAEGIIDYDKVVQYPFGYGLSYTSFTQTMSDLTVNGNEISFSVTVTNTGDKAGRDTVQVFYNPPYTNGGIEKASANLLDFEKTKILNPGESQTVSFKFQNEDMAAYDEKGQGCYVLESGDYVISINNNSHNILDSKTYTQAETVVYNESNPRSTDDQPAVNRLQNAQGDVVFLSRADHFANYEAATAAPANTEMAAEYIAGYHLNSNYDPNAYIDPNAQMPTTGASGKLTIYDVRGKSYDDTTWEKLLDQLTVDEMSNMIALAGYQTPAIDSIKKVQNIDSDGPAAINNNFTGAGSLGFPIEVVIACSWSKEVATAWGEVMGQMAQEMGSTGWYAPAVNTHRSAFTARNYEYFSEDGVLAGIMAGCGVKGALSKGVYSTVKHFAMYDSNGKMVCAWATEQSMREIYLKPFEIAIKAYGANGIMESWAFLGNKWVGEMSELNNDILRGEWGFRGFIVSDFFRNNGHGFMNADMALANGVDAMLSTYAGGPNQVTDKTAASNVQYMRTASKNILFTTANSWIYDDAHKGGDPAPWKTAFYAVDAVIGLLILAGAVMIYLNYRKKSKKA